MTQPRDLLLRFTRGERWVHRATGVVMGVCMTTAAVLYVGPLSVMVGRRHLVETIHVYSGIALPVPIVLGWLSAAFRRDARLLNRFSRDDWAWLRSRTRRDGHIGVGKFNAGQKLNAAFSAGAIAVMLGTGLVMRYANGWPVTWRTGATFVHDWLSYALVAVLAGHLWFASRDPFARQGMRTGTVPRFWAKREHAAWEATAQVVEPDRSSGRDGTSGREASATANSPTGPDARAAVAGPEG